METALSSKAVLDMAIGMEEIAETFFEALALGSDDPRVAAFCAATAHEEARHRLTFAQILQEFDSVAATRRVSRDSTELAAMAKRSIQPDPAVVHGVAVGGDRKAALIMAVLMERDAIRFYQGMLSTLPDSTRTIRAIIVEEQRHLRALQSFQSLAV